nr:restriction endonuclease subunit S [Dysgonomonas sp. BGC7]
MFIPESKDAIKIYEQKNAIYKDVEIGGYYISDKKFDELKGFQVFPDDIIVSCAGTIGETYVMPKKMRKGIINQALMRIKLYNHEILDFYLLYFDFVLKNQANEQGKGTAIKNIPPFDILKNFLIPLPPIEEQYRMRNFIKTIAKDLDSVDENRNAISVLVAQAKSKILDLAIRGKLVPQDPNDEPASVLLKRIKAEHPKSKKKAKNISDNSHYPFIIPASWNWCRLENGCSLITDGTHQTPIYSETGFVFLSSKNVTSGKINWENVKHIPEDLHNVLHARLAPQLNDILLAKNGTTGIGALVDRECVFDIYVSLALLRPITEMFFPEYILLVINSPFVKSQFNQSLKGIGVPNLHLEYIRKVWITLPPILEQERIVKKVEEIFTSLDEIENSIKA